MAPTPSPKEPAVPVPARSQTVVIGGGVIGCSIAYHLARRGHTDVTVVERASLTHGSTWHAAGLVGQLRSSATLTRLMRASVRTYADLERQTGYATGWHGVGSLRLAASPARWTELRRLAAAGHSFGFEVHLVSPAEAAELFPGLCTAGLHGATWVPSDGYVDPSQLTHAFATGARAAGVRIVGHCRVESLVRRGRRVVAVVTEQGPIECDTVVNATGMWGAETARLAGVAVAVAAVEHQYVVTEKTAELPAGLPTLRDPDAGFYLKPEAGALLVGGWERGTRAPWLTVPHDFGPELFPPDHDRFAVLAEGATRRIPLLDRLGVQTWVNGPIPFTPDAEPLMGLTEELDNLYHCCGFSAGIAAAGGAGAAMADWIVDGDPGMDLWAFDVRRFGPAHSVPGYLQQRAIDAYGHYYAPAWPHREVGAPRGQRRSPLDDLLRARGGVAGEKFGWEQPSWFAPPGTPAREEPTFGRSNAWPHIAAEHRAVREAAGVVDLTSLARFEVTGPGALELLERLAGAEMDVPVGVVVPTVLLNARGGIEADVTLTRLARQRFHLVTGAGLGRHDLAFLLAHAPQDGSVTVTEVTSASAVLGLYGPRAQEIAARLCPEDLSPAAFPPLSARHTSLAHAPVLALRTGLGGEPGWQLHVPTEHARDLYERLLDCGADLGLRDVGHRALDSLRLERHRPAWGVDLGGYTTPDEAGLSDAVRAEKTTLLAGPALRRLARTGPGQRLCWFSTTAEAVMHGGELLVHPATGTRAGVRSAGHGHTVGRTIFSAYLPAALAAAADDDDGGGGGEMVVEVAGEAFPARRDPQPLYPRERSGWPPDVTQISH